MDKMVSKIVALGLVLLLAVLVNGYVGGAVLTAALAAIGPFGIYVQVIKELIKKGETKESILKKIDSYKISKQLKLELKYFLSENCPKDLDNLE